MLKKAKIKAFAMIYAVVVLIFITIICAAFIMLMYYNKLYLDISIQKERLSGNARSGINLFLADKTIIGVNETKSIQLYDSKDDEIKLTRKKWGVFDLIFSTALWQKHDYTKIAMTGDNSSETDNVALYLADRDKSLGLCGATLIKGDCYLPKAGVVRTYIEGKNFVGTDLINGTVKKSEKKLPDFICIKELYNIIESKKIIDEHDSLFLYDKSMGDTLINPFSNKTYILYSTDDISLENKYFKGNIKIISGKSVKVDKSNMLQDIIIIAPYISFKKEFSGSIQAFATDSLIVEGECELIYPSAIGMIITKTDTIQPYIYIRDKAKVNGIVFLYDEKSPAVLRPYIKIDKDAEITGQLISTCDLQLQGTVIGSVYCNRFILKTPSSYYENNLLDATIDFSGLPKEYVGISLDANQKRKKIIKWLF